MCRPDFYTVDYEINPWMSVKKKPDSSLVIEQWQQLYDAFQKLDITVNLVNPVAGLPDMVFTANAGLVFEKKFIPSCFRHEQRKAEEEHFIKWFKKNKYQIINLPEDLYFEGEGDALFFNDTLLAGYRYRSDINSHCYISEQIEKEVLSLELVNPEFYHLDTCFCPLNSEAALFYPQAFDEYGNKVLKNLIPKLIAVKEEDAANFCCNAVVLDKTIIVNQISKSLRKKLEKESFEVVEFKDGEEQ